ncbi:MAG: glycerol-3-phosphate 1-O-acyltransferase PlsY [Clostridia bacterium]|nr:glycerol-3-phosphate 1-O-acyltransferase PlsY [Clostridia bacterium]
MGSYIVVAILAYMLGSISFSVIFGKKFAGIDVREHGSKNAGSTNTLRTAGKKAAICTLICDILKGVVAVLIGFIVGNFFENVDKALLVQIAGICVVLGHVFPIFFKFKGGKGVATSLGVLLIMNWQIGLICLAFAVVIMALTRMVSVGSVLAAILFPILTVFIHQNYIVPGGSYIVFGIILAALVIFLHRSNIQRILEGKENKLSFKSKN